MVITSTNMSDFHGSGPLQSGQWNVVAEEPLVHALRAPGQFCWVEEDRWRKFMTSQCCDTFDQLSASR